MMRRSLIFVLAVLMLAACSKQAPEISAQEQVPAEQRTEAPNPDGTSDPGDGGDGSVEGATWVAVDIDFAEAPSTLPAGETEVTLVNEGAALHNVTIDGEVVVEAQGGGTETGTVSLEPGTHEFICSVPGHESLMNGEITVE